MKITKKHKELKWKESIDLLNDIVKIKLAPSPIHGVGVFALRDIKKDEKLYADVIPNAFDLPYSKLKQLKPYIADIILGHWPQIINGSHFLYPVTKMTAFLNHSENPNYDASKDIVLRDIKEGEEITEDYRTLNNYQKVFKWLK